MGERRRTSSRQTGSVPSCRWCASRARRLANSPCFVAWPQQAQTPWARGCTHRAPSRSPRCGARTGAVIASGAGTSTTAAGQLFLSMKTMTTLFVCSHNAADIRSQLRRLSLSISPKLTEQMSGHSASSWTSSSTPCSLNAASPWRSSTRIPELGPTLRRRGTAAREVTARALLPRLPSAGASDGGSRVPGRARPCVPYGAQL